ncbi:MAG TPA: DUF1699 family protein [Methanothrix sp.]
MRLRVIKARNEIPNLSPNEKNVHLGFGASNVDFLNLMQRCPRLRMIQVPPSYRETMSSAIQVFLEMQGIDLLEGDVWDHRSGLDEYFTVDDSTLEEIRALTASGAAVGEAANRIQKKVNLGSELIRYIARTKATA